MDLLFFLFPFCTLWAFCTSLDEILNPDLSAYAASYNMPPGHYYAGRAELRVTYEKESPWRGRPSNSTIYRYGPIVPTPDYNTYLKSPGINYADYLRNKTRHGGAGYPGKGHLPLLGGYPGPGGYPGGPGGYSPQKPLYGSLYGDKGYRPYEYGPSSSAPGNSTMSTPVMGNSTVASSTPASNDTSSALLAPALIASF
ncbi:uncharacterized protein LOC129590700 [Paramacrobiotus metropolitanus]|uniref:uncharacterized protein LOC129590700 n=1 Tax=Paramacrobiotus metropolitanus TaxID=2943436 RepID=UPI002445E3E3|nr:uncharacterized protein LOC129590700 [Paramacrobiotus metropolitanus]